MAAGSRQNLTYPSLPANNMWDLWNGKMVGNQIKAQLWRIPAADIPKDPEAQKVWLLDQWKKVDQWVAEHARVPGSESHAPSRATLDVT